MAISFEQVLGLAPTEVENLRASRYRSEEQAIASSELLPEDAATARELYATLGALQQGLEALAKDDDPAFITTFTTFRASHDIDGLLLRVRRLGRSSGDDLRLQSAFHDLRGGALTGVFLYLTRRSPPAPVATVKQALLIAARDHRKMMRNVLLDIDEAARARDLEPIPHSLGQLASALRSLGGAVRGERLVVDVSCPVDAVVAESCVEVAALDRVSYNLLNNAVRHADGPLVQVWLTTLAEDVRFVVANQASPEDRATLGPVLEHHPASMYGSFTTTGSGHGLRIVADLVGRAYGVASTTVLVDEGYIGCRLVDEAFVTWFHWPLSGA